MQKKLSQNLVIGVNAISFTFAAVFGAIGIFAAIANFTGGDWYIYGFGIESLLGTIPTSFFLAIMALVFGILAKTTIKKITDAALLKQTYGTIATITGLLTALFVAVALSIAIYALVCIGSKGVDQAELWLSGFLSAAICAGVSFGVAMLAKKISDGNIAILPVLTTVVLCISGVSALLMLISTIVNLYGGGSKTSGSYLDDMTNGLGGLLDLF